MAASARRRRAPGRPARRRPPGRTGRHPRGRAHPDRSPAHTDPGHTGGHDRCPRCRHGVPVIGAVGGRQHRGCAPPGCAHRPRCCDRKRRRGEPFRAGSPR
ncbi:hypothetical protein E3T61_16135 [Cryobacterium lactosi]|uniref:Uncharacterized protein n=1 Tax=Cryobacterium lactosi TaxID=1259202 RepID=A0A4R9BLM2_9MICO|nr:hypothetical protein E3T61_16135 [Cryobacterium lactosi]